MKRRYSRLLWSVTLPVIGLFFVFLAPLYAQTSLQEDDDWLLILPGGVTGQGSFTRDGKTITSDTFSERSGSTNVQQLIHKPSEEFPFPDRYAVTILEYTKEAISKPSHYDYIYFVLNVDGNASPYLEAGDTILVYDGVDGVDGFYCDQYTHCVEHEGSPDDLLFEARVTGYLATSMNIHWKIFVDVDSLGSDDDSEDSELPGTHPGAGGGNCVLTTTLTFSNTEELTTTLGITSTDGITITQGVSPTDGITATIPYTRKINLVSNAGFESGNPPTDWDKLKDATLLAGMWSNLVTGVGWGGSRAVQSNAGEFDFLQDISLAEVGATYSLGFHIRCTDENPNCSESASIYWGQMTIGGSATAPIASGSPVSATYTQISGTKASGGGLANISIKTTGSNAYIDDVFLYAIDPETGSPLCDPALYEPLPGSGGGGGGGGLPGDPGYGVTPIGGVPAPIGGAGATCYNCFAPSNASQGAVSYWIAWLGCVIRNMFSCSLRVWLLVVGNWIKGNVEIGKAFLLWIPATTQGFVDWIATQVVPGIGTSVSVVTEPATNFWDLLVAIVQMINTIIGGLLDLLSLVVSLFADLIGMLAGAILGIVKLLVELVGAVNIAFSVEPIEFDLNGVTDPQPGSGGGPSSDKMLWLFLAFLGLIDRAVIGNNLDGIFAVALAALAIGLIIWTFSWWQDLLSF